MKHVGLICEVGVCFWGAQRLTPEDALERVGGLLGETAGPATNADGVVKKPMGQAANVQGNQEESGPVVKVAAANHNQVG